MNKGIVLLSGGLDSLVSLGLYHTDISLALTFNYGQKAAKSEIAASKKICEFYNIKHKIVNLDWLKDITNTALVSDKELPEGIDNPIESAKNVWVPNRNGLFLNIAGAFADSGEYDSIYIGANKEEAGTFSDNTQQFIESINSEFEFSTQNHPKVIAPLINSDKSDIVKLALDNNIPLDLVMSCYLGGKKHCGRCESCTRLKNALIANNDKFYIGKLF